MEKKKLTAENMPVIDYAPGFFYTDDAHHIEPAVVWDIAITKQVALTDRALAELKRQVTEARQ